MNKTQIIYHLADIHISSDEERYDEYEKVFEKFYKLLEEEKKEKIVVICGDLFHEKTGMQSYCIKFCSKFLAKIARYSEIILIDGNHDINMNNKENEIKKISTIEGVLELLNGMGLNNKFHYLNENKIVKIRGINYGLTTMFSEEITKIENKNADELYIGLYHGSIKGSITDRGYNVKESENGKITIRDMEKYDLFLLGDIHRFQFLNNKKTIAYPSSLIQQNYGEDVNGHGLIRWDLEKKQGEFIEIANEYCFIQGKMINKTLNINEEIDLTKYKYIRAKIEYSFDKKIDIIRIENKLKKMFNIKEITLYEKIKPIENNKKNDNIDLDNKNIIDIHEEIINKKNYTTEEKEELKKIILNIVNEKDLLKEKGHKTIQLEKLSFNNLFCYGLNNSIDFTKLNKINGIIAENGWGKSSIIDILLYSIYQKCGRTKGVKVLNKFKNGGSVNLSFTLNNIPHSIVRIINPRNNKGEFREELEFYKNEKKINESYKKDTGKIIEEIFGSYDELTDNNILLQNGRNFIDKTDHEKKIIMYKIFGIDVYNNIYEYVNNKILSFNKEIKVITKNLLDTDLEKNSNEKKNKLLNELEESENELKEIEAKIFEQNYAEKKIKEILNNKITDIETIDSNINENNKIIEENNEELKKTIKDYDSNNSEKILDEIKKNIDMVQIQKDNLMYKLTELKSQIKTITKIDNKIDLIKKIKNNKNKLEKLKNDKLEIKLPDNINIKEIKNKIKELKNIEKEYLTSIKFLEELEKENEFLIKHKFNERCSECMSNKKIHEEINYMDKILKLKNFIMTNVNIDNTLYDQEKILQDYEKIIVLTKQIDDLNNDNINIEKLISICEENNKNKINNDMVNKKINLLLDEIKTKEEEIKTKNMNLNKIKKIIKKNTELLMSNEKLYQERKIYNENYDQIEKNKLLLINQNENLTHKKSLVEKIKNIEKDINTIINNINSNKKIMENIHKIKIEQNKYEKILLIYTEDKLIQKILEKVINNIESIVNNILKDITNFTLKFEINDDGIVINKFYKNEYIDARFLSGYEKFASNVALRIAFGKLNKYIKNDYLIIDEGFSSCDHKNINKIHTIFDVIRKYYKWCIVISHIDQIKNNFDKTYFIKKMDNIYNDSLINI
jgi:DNA repair exonuclease SbcCD ATPase subunit